MHIRPGEPGDARAVAGIQIRGWHAAYEGIMPDDHLAAMNIESRAPIWERLLAEGVTFVAEAATGIAGFCSVGAVRDDDLDSSKVGEIHALYVEPDSWRGGVGWSLCGAGTTWMRHRSFESASLWVLQRNTIGRAFYEKFGFTPDGATAIYKASALELVELRYRMSL